MVNEENARRAQVGASMDLEDFKAQVRRAFGEDLHRASPATVRDFLDRLQEDTQVGLVGDKRIHLEESAKSYEEVMRTFFAQVLDLPAEEAIMMLWAVAFDLSYAVIESHDAGRIGHLFRGLEEPAP